MRNSQTNAIIAGNEEYWERLWSVEYNRPLQGSMGEAPERGNLREALLANPGTTISSGLQPYYQAQHLVPVEAIERLSDLFGTGLEVNGKFMPGIGISTNGVQNGVFLPSDEILSRLSGYSRHSTDVFGAHPGYNKAVTDYLLQIKSNVVTQLTAGQDVDSVMDYALGKVKELQDTLRVLQTRPYGGTKLPSLIGKPMPLHGDEAAIASLWKAALSELISP